MKIFLVILFSLFLPIPSDAAEPQPIPDSPWKLARAVLHAYKTQDRDALRSFFCWDGADSTIRAMTEGYIDDSMRRGAVSVTFKPLTGEDQVLAFGADSTTYRHNLEHVGYLCASAAQVYAWNFSVGRDARGYRITLWAPAAKQITMAEWNRPPSPREWLDGHYRDSSRHWPSYYNFKDSVEEATYYRDLLALVLEGEVSGQPSWMSAPHHVQTRLDIMENLRVQAVGGRCPSSFITMPAIRWCLFNEPDPFAQDQMSLLESIHLPAADSLIVEVLTRGHPNTAIIEQALSIADQRHINVSRSALLSYLQSYRPSIANAAHRLNDHLGYPPYPAFDLVNAINSPGVRQILESLDSLFIPPLGPETRFVSITSHRKDSPDANDDATFRGWMVQADSSSTTLMTPEGRVETIPPKLPFTSEQDSSSDRIDVQLTDIGLEEEAARIIHLRGVGNSPSELADPFLWAGPNTDVAHVHEVFLGYRLHKARRDSLAAQILLPGLEAFRSDSELLDAARSTSGLFHGYDMLAAFAGARDYPYALREAKLIATRFPRSRFGVYAKELVRQIPLRMEDYKGLHLPTRDEWDNMRAKMSRQEQIRFLCDRIGLLSDRSYGPQYAEAPGMDQLAFGFLGLGKTPVINPLIELNGVPGQGPPGGPTPPKGLHLAVADIPILAPYLLDNSLLGVVHSPSGNFDLHYDPGSLERSMTETREVIAGIVQSLLPHNLCRVEDLDKMSEADREKRIARIVAWAERNKDRDHEAQVIDAVKESQNYLELHPMMDYLVEHKVKEAVPKLLSFLNTDILSYRNRNYVLAECRKIDSASCMPAARKYLVDTSYMARFNAGLIAYGSGEKVDGLMAMAGAFEDDNGCFLRSGDPIEDAVSLLLSSRGADELEVASLPLTTRCFHDSRPEDQWPLIRLFSEAHHPAGFETFLKGLADSSITESRPLGNTMVEVQKREAVAKFILENLVPSDQRVPFQYEDPISKRVAAVTVAKNWVVAQIDEMKRYQN